MTLVRVGVHFVLLVGPVVGKKKGPTSQSSMGSRAAAGEARTSRVKSKAVRRSRDGTSRGSG
jgi:hypothetical protein